MQKILTDIFIFIFGSIVGSFLNVCIYRMPLGESIVKPRSHCPKCKKLIPWYDNIPFLSYIILKGKCRFCKNKISFRYFSVELITAIIFLVLFRKFGLSFDYLAYAIFCSGLIIASFIDWEHQIIPDEISVGGAAAGLIISCLKALSLSPINFNLSAVLNSLLGILIGGGITYITGLLGNFIFKKESMGGGDVKLMAMIGSFLGWKLSLFTFFIAPVFGLVVGIVILIKTKNHLIPYGPFLSLAAIVTLFWGNRILTWFFF